MAGEKIEKSAKELQDQFAKKERNLKEKADKPASEPVGEPVEEQIVDEAQVAAKAKAAEEEIEKSFLSEKSKAPMLEALDALLKRQKQEVSKNDAETKEALVALFDNTTSQLQSFKEQPEVKEVYEPLSKLFKNKEAYLKATNLTQYGLSAKEGSKNGYWETIQEELLSKASMTQDNIKAVQKILGLEEDGKVGPKTIEATWAMLTGEKKDVKNVIREKGKTEKAPDDRVTAIIEADRQKEKAAAEVAVAEATAAAAAKAAAVPPPEGAKPEVAVGEPLPAEPIPGALPPEVAQPVVSAPEAAPLAGSKLDASQPSLPENAEITPPSPEQMAQIMQQNFGELLNDKSWSLNEDMFSSPEYNAGSKTIEIKYPPGQNPNQITFVYHMDSKTRELQFKGDLSEIVYNKFHQLLIDQWEACNGKTYGANEESAHGMLRVSTREKSAEVAAKNRKTPTEILKKDGGGWKEKVTNQEWRDITIGLERREQPVSSDMKKLLHVMTGLPEFDIPDKVFVGANFDIAGCQKINKPTIEIARETGCDATTLKKVEVAIGKGKLPPRMDVPNPPVGSVIVAYDIFVTRSNRMSVFTEQGPKEVKMV